jgi:hypothetical protein
MLIVNPMIEGLITCSKLKIKNKDEKDNNGKCVYKMEPLYVLLYYCRFLGERYEK